MELPSAWYWILKKLTLCKYSSWRIHPICTESFVLETTRTFFSMTRSSGVVETLSVIVENLGWRSHEEDRRCLYWSLRIQPGSLLCWHHRFRLSCWFNLRHLKWELEAFYFQVELWRNTRSVSPQEEWQALRRIWIMTKPPKWKHLIFSCSIVIKGNLCNIFSSLKLIAGNKCNMTCLNHFVFLRCFLRALFFR